MPLTLDFLGAAQSVTGSRTLVSFHGRRWLIDCGLFQGIKDIRALNWAPFTPAPSFLHGVVLTHAHLDHCGYLPVLARQGYQGPIHATRGTVEIAKLTLRDAAKLEEEQASYANRTDYSNHKPALPLFDEEDAERAIRQLEGHERDNWFPWDPHLSFRFLRAGHITGASLVQVHVTTEKGPKIITFSGDLGHNRSLVLKGPVTLSETNVLVLESTYGNRIQSRQDGLKALGEVARRTFARGGVLLIPAFAVGRAMEVVHMFRRLEDSGEIPSVPIILDSPMAASALRVSLAQTEDHVLESGFLADPTREDAFRPRHFEISETTNDSMLACMRQGPLVVISASGMLNGGRILHHLKHRLPHASNTLLFSGYQAEGTKGRWLQDWSKGLATGHLRIHHKEVEIEAEIVTLDELSAHADADDIMAWLGALKRPPEMVILNHGEVDAQKELAKRMRKTLGWTVQTASESPRVILESWK